MANPLEQTVNTFTSTLNSIWGGGGNKAKKAGTDELLTPQIGAKLGGSLILIPENWTGNTGRKNKLKYGFVIVPASFISPDAYIEGVGSTLNATQGLRNEKTGIISKISDNPYSKNEVYYLDIPPQSITQKEIFASNIQATRKGVVVESEGVVFKDIIIEGTTGVFPGERGNYSGNRANIKWKDAGWNSELTGDFSAEPETGGVSSDGTSFASGVTTYSGYEEFIKLRQYFLSYANQKVTSEGGVFLVFINQKDSQSLLVEPLEFTMLRNSKNPLAYNYRIVLKCIGSLEQMFSAEKDDLSLFDNITNVFGNISAAIQQSRATMNASKAVLEGLAQGVTNLVLNPFRQVQFAVEDASYGVSSILSLPTNLAGNASSASLDIREANSAISQAYQASHPSKPKPKEEPAKGIAQESPTTDPLTAEQQSIANIANRVAIDRDFLDKLKQSMRQIEDDLADSINLGSTAYNAIVNRLVTVQISPLVEPTDEQLLLLSAMRNAQMSLNLILATNGAFEADVNAVFEQQTDLYKGVVHFRPPQNVTQITIQQGETLEKIATRVYGNPNRWVDLVILNNLKPPFIDVVKADGVLTEGDTILVGV